MVVPTRCGPCLASLPWALPGAQGGSAGYNFIPTLGHGSPKEDPGRGLISTEAILDGDIDFPFRNILWWPAPAEGASQAGRLVLWNEHIPLLSLAAVWVAAAGLPAPARAWPASPGTERSSWKMQLMSFLGTLSASAWQLPLPRGPCGGAAWGPRLPQAGLGTGSAGGWDPGGPQGRGFVPRPGRLLFPGWASLVGGARKEVLRTLGRLSQVASRCALGKPRARYPREAWLSFCRTLLATCGWGRREVESPSPPASGCCLESWCPCWLQQPGLPCTGAQRWFGADQGHRLSFSAPPPSVLLLACGQS